MPAVIGSVGHELRKMRRANPGCAMPGKATAPSLRATSPSQDNSVKRDVLSVFFTVEMKMMFALNLKGV